jgi:hypothetical protein
MAKDRGYGGGGSALRLVFVSRCAWLLLLRRWRPATTCSLRRVSDAWRLRRDTTGQERDQYLNQNQ